MNFIFYAIYFKWFLHIVPLIGSKSNAATWSVGVSI